MMTTQNVPGSIFKTVTAAAAIDYGLNNPSRLFNCDLTIDGDSLRKQIGHLEC